MDADEIVPLTAESVIELMEADRSAEGPQPETGRRTAPRWPFPGTVQFWLTGESGQERLAFGTCCNLSTRGLGVRTDEQLPVDASLPIAIHLPQASYHGRATVRHCMKTRSGYFVGLAFDFE